MSCYESNKSLIEPYPSLFLVYPYVERKTCVSIATVSIPVAYVDTVLNDPPIEMVSTPGGFYPMPLMLL